VAAGSYRVQGKDLDQPPSCHAALRQFAAIRQNASAWTAAKNAKRPDATTSQAMVSGAICRTVVARAHGERRLRTAMTRCHWL